MENFESLSAGIIRFSLIAFVLLGACWWVLRNLKQPLERIRLIEVSLLASVLTLALVMVDVVPKVDLALLPAAESSQRITAPVEPASAKTGIQLNEPMTVDPSFRGGTRTVSSNLSDEESTATDRASEVPQQKSVVEANNGLAFLHGLKRLFIAAFLVVCGLNLVYLAVGYVATRRLVSTAKPLSDSARARVGRIVKGFSTHHHVSFASSIAIDVPMVVGIWRATILLPERLTHADADPLELKHSIAHEWGHVQLNDLLTWQLVNICQTFLWIQPCYWVLRRELRIAQDQLADRFAIEQTQEPATYAATLLELSRARQRLLPGALTMAGKKSNLYRRIEMLMNENFRLVRATSKSTLLLVVVLFVAAGGLLTSLQLTRAESPAASESTSPPLDDEKKEPVAEKDDQEKSVEHLGVVRDADTGKPIAGVTVTVTRMESYDWQELAISKSLTDENGKYTFTIPPDQLKQSLLYILFDIDHPQYAQRHCGSYSYGMIADNLKNGEQPWFSELKMVRGERISGRLVDEQKMPVAGAQIRCNSKPKSNTDRERSAWLDGVSDKDGRFEMMVPYDGVTKLSFVPLDHCMKHIEIGEKHGDLGDITLTSGFPIHGVVKDAKGNPMSGLWVNLTPEKDEQEASYEMKRSAKTDADGKFVTRPLKAEKHQVEVEMKATGALEKEKYANFKDTPPPAMFVKRSISVTEDAANKPFVIQAVPHVSITVKTFTPSGEVSGGHSPSMTGKFDGQFYWSRSGKRTGKGAYELLVPHGIEDAELRFITNEHSALMAQFEGSEPTPQNSFRFKKLEENIDNIRVIRHKAGILKLDIVDESGKKLENAGIFAHYDIAEKPSEEMMMGTQIGWNNEDGFFRLSSIVPGVPVSVRFSASGFKTQTEKFTLDTEERRTVTVKLKKGEDEKPAVEK